MPTASDEPRLSKIAQSGRWRSSPCLFSMLHTVPDEPMRRRRRQVPAAGIGVQRLQHRLGEGHADDRDRRRPSAARPRSRARSALKPRARAGVATAPPPVSAIRAVNWAGAVHQRRGGDADLRSLAGSPAAIAASTRSAASSGRGRRRAEEEVAAAAEHEEQVLLAPHHALGHAGGAAGVEDQQIVARAAPGRARPGPRSRRRWRRSPRRTAGPDGRARPPRSRPSPSAAGRGSRRPSAAKEAWNTTASASALSNR